MCFQEEDVHAVNNVDQQEPEEGSPLVRPHSVFSWRTNRSSFEAFLPQHNLLLCCKIARLAIPQLAS